MSLFTLLHSDKHSRARTGILHTAHGDIETPCFMPVGTKATVKTLDSRDLEAAGAQIILGNAYHLHLRPGEELIDRAGGLHKFMHWNAPILTDSGGFQVFSLGAQKEKTSSNEKLVSIDEDGVTFRSHIDGSQHRFTPESAIDIQHKLGADIIMAFDECTPDSAPLDYARQAMIRTHAWAQRCITAHKKETSRHGYAQYLFGIIQGANHKDLRQESAHAISSMDFDGIAIGGESIGYNMQATVDILDWLSEIIPEHKPHYTMGVGASPKDLFEVVERGIDMFDCVAPTRMARNGALFIRRELSKNYRLDITNAKFRKDAGPIDATCSCFTCRSHTRQYLHHLFREEELLAYRLATIHNVHFMLQLMRDMRAAIREDRFMELKREWCID